MVVTVFFRRPVLAVVLAVVIMVLSTGCTARPRTAPRPSTAPTPLAVASAPWPSAEATRTENARHGDRGWIVAAARPALLQGWADDVSVHPGGIVGLHVAAAHSYTVNAYRTGWYAGVGGRLVWTSGLLPPQVQPAPTMTAATRTVSAANWRTTLAVSTAGWPPGVYVLVLRDGAGDGWQIPLTVLSPTTAGALVLMNAVTTWAAYDAWGGYSLYHGPSGARADRAYAVTFDRPYDFGTGAADFDGNEWPAIALAEKLGMPVAYVTDVDLARDPHLLDGARALVSLGHDEYWSQTMLDAALTARSRGVNLAFLGANAAYRHIRLQPSPFGPARVVVNYKGSAGLDPVMRTNPREATFDWPSGPFPRPESALTGAMYRCNGVHADLVVADPSHWLLRGLDVRAGQHFAGMVGDEYDGVGPGVRSPQPLQVLFHSPLVCGGVHDAADVTWYTTPSGAGVFDASTSAWVCMLVNPDVCGPQANDAGSRLAIAVTSRLLLALARGPAGIEHPAAGIAAASR